MEMWLKETIVSRISKADNNSIAKGHLNKILFF